VLLGLAAGYFIAGSYFFLQARKALQASRVTLDEAYQMLEQVMRHETRAKQRERKKGE